MSVIHTYKNLMKVQLAFPQHIVDVHLYHEHVKKMAVRGDVIADI